MCIRDSILTNPYANIQNWPLPFGTHGLYRYLSKFDIGPKAVKSDRFYIRLDYTPKPIQALKLSRRYFYRSNEYNCGYTAKCQTKCDWLDNFNVL